MDQDCTPSMNQAIFNLKLEVEATSLYLLCCGLADTGQTVFFKDLVSVWNGDIESLEKSIATLEKLQILAVHQTSAKDNESYTLLPAEKWKT